MDDVADIFARKMLLGRTGRSSFTTDARSVISTAFAWLSKTVPTSGFYLASLERGLVDE